MIIRILGETCLAVAAVFQIIPLSMMNEAIAERLGLKNFKRTYFPPLVKDMVEGKAETQPQRDLRIAKQFEKAIRVHNIVNVVTLALILAGFLLIL